MLQVLNRMHRVRKVEYCYLEKRCVRYDDCPTLSCFFSLPHCKLTKCMRYIIQIEHCHRLDCQSIDICTGIGLGFPSNLNVACSMKYCTWY